MTESKTLTMVKERFPSDVQDHKMQILHDDGLYRHVRFRKPGTGMYGFDLITWPGYLTIAGDMGTFTFAREQNMFGWFGTNPQPSYDYWAQKIVGGSPTKRYEPVLQVEQVREHVAQEREYMDRDESWYNNLEQILDTAHDMPDASILMQDLQDFDAMMFSDVYEFDGLDWSYHYLWCCHAIPWGIRKYRAEKD